MFLLFEDMIKIHDYRRDDLLCNDLIIIFPFNSQTTNLFTPRPTIGLKSSKNHLTDKTHTICIQNFSLDS